MFVVFQAEDGIRDGHVSGVQTCALPILDSFLDDVISDYQKMSDMNNNVKRLEEENARLKKEEIGRASRREREEMSVEGVQQGNKDDDQRQHTQAQIRNDGRRHVHR